MNKPIQINDGDKVLISRTDKLGDLVLALPFVETFKKRYPNCKVDVMASLYASPILEHNDAINKILRVQNDQLHSNNLYRKDLLQKIKKEKYDIVIVLYPERQISRLYYKAEIPIRIGTAGRFHSIFFNTRLLHSRKKNIKHESAYNLDFMSFFKDGETVVDPKVYLTEKDILSAEKTLKVAGVERDFIVLHPGSGGSAEAWSSERFLQLYKKLESQGVVVVVSGSKDEGKMFDNLSNKIGFADMNQITGSTDLRTLSAVLSLAKVVVANSTGPLHLAVAVGTKTVGLYPSKKSMSPTRWGPLGTGNVVVQPDVSCNCPDGKCACMEKIEPGDVATKVLKVISS